jgi:tRNA modification GTPase
MSQARNIALLLTPPGVAAIAVIRLRGPGVSGFLKRHFSKSAKLNRCVHAELFDANGVIDDAVVVLCDVETADLNVHGGQWVVQSVLDLAARQGFEVAEAGDLPIPFDATDGGTVLELEIEAYLPMPRTELGVRALLNQNDSWHKLRRRLKEDPVEGRRQLEEVLSDQTLVHLLYPPTVAIVGAANVGKSTLANQLFSQERSITADVPGTTRDWVGEIANIDGMAVMLMDTPGWRHTHDPIEATAIERSRDEIARAKLVILVLDATRALEGEQAELLREFSGALLVMNKSDRPLIPEFETVQGMRTVATSGEGINDLRTAITRHFCTEVPINPRRPRIWTQRQRDIVRRAVIDPAVLDEVFTANG